MLDRPDAPCSPDAGLHLVVDVEDPVLGAQLRQSGREICRHRDEAAFALDGLEHDAGDRLRIDVGLEQMCERGKRVVRRDTTIGVRRRRSVHLGRERPEARLVRLDLARHRHRQQRPPVESVVEDDDRGTTCGSARELDRVLHGLGSGIHEDRFLLGACARRELRQAAAHLDVRLVHADHEALMEIAVGLLVDGVDDRTEAVTGVLTGNPAREVEERSPVDRRDPRALCGRDDEPRSGDAAGDVPRPVRQDPLGRSGVRGLHRAIITASGRGR